MVYKKREERMSPDSCYSHKCVGIEDVREVHASTIQT